MKVFRVQAKKKINKKSQINLGQIKLPPAIVKKPHDQRGGVVDSHVLQLSELFLDYRCRAVVQSGLVRSNQATTDTTEYKDFINPIKGLIFPQVAQECIQKIPNVSMKSDLKNTNIWRVPEMSQSQFDTLVLTLI